MKALMWELGVSTRIYRRLNKLFDGLSHKIASRDNQDNGTFAHSSWCTYLSLVTPVRPLQISALWKDSSHQKAQTGLHLLSGESPFVPVMIDVCVKRPVITVYTRFGENALSLIVNLYKVLTYINAEDRKHLLAEGFVRIFL